MWLGEAQKSAASSALRLHSWPRRRPRRRGALPLPPGAHSPRPATPPARRSGFRSYWDSLSCLPLQIVRFFFGYPDLPGRARAWDLWWLVTAHGWRDRRRRRRGIGGSSLAGRGRSKQAKHVSGTGCSGVQTSTRKRREQRDVPAQVRRGGMARRGGGRSSSKHCDCWRRDASQAGLQERTNFAVTCRRRNSVQAYAIDPWSMS